MGCNSSQVRLPDSGCAYVGEGDFTLDDILVRCMGLIL